MAKAYAGIDVAFAKDKRLPIVVCTLHDDVVEPLPLRNVKAKPPAGKGNAQILNYDVISGFADETAAYLRTVETLFGVKIQRIAIDAPSDPKPDGTRRRRCELGLDQRQISCITTPSLLEFEDIRKRAAEHLVSGGAESRMPGANQLWMLEGFALFDRLQREWECLEVFPQAIAAVLDARQVHKSESEGFLVQLKAVAHHTGWPGAAPGTGSVAQIGYGNSHDRLDAYMAAWVASLDDSEREPIGIPPRDAIWVPRIDGQPAPPG
jgi:hypothetical protein